MRKANALVKTEGKKQERSIFNDWTSIKVITCESVPKEIFDISVMPSALHTSSEQIEVMSCSSQAVDKGEKAYNHCR